MTGKLKLARVILIGIFLLIGVFCFASCTQPATLSSRLPAVSVIPDVGLPKAKVSFVGASFEPGEKVRIVMLLQPSEEFVLGSSGAGLALEINELGSFILKDKLPAAVGVYAVVVYNQKGKPLASTVILVKGE